MTLTKSHKIVVAIAVAVVAIPVVSTIVGVTNCSAQADKLYAENKSRIDEFSATKITASSENPQAKVTKVSNCFEASPAVNASKSFSVSERSETAYVSVRSTLQSQGFALTDERSTNVENGCIQSYVATANRGDLNFDIAVRENCKAADTSTTVQALYKAT